MAVSITRTADPASASPSGQTTTYSAQSIGTAAVDRIVAVVISQELATTTIASVTLGGSAMTQAVTQVFSAQRAYTYLIPISTGTTAGIIITWTGTAPTSSQHHISVYRVLGADFPVVTADDTSTDMDSSSPLSAAIVVPTNGNLLAVCSHAAATTVTWGGTGVTEDLDETVSATYGHSTAIGTSSGTITCTCTGTTNQEDGVFVIVSFAPTANLPIGRKWEIPAFFPPIGPPAITWLQTNAAILTPSVQKPLNQYDWPLPKVAEHPNVLRTWTSAGASVQYGARYLPSRVTDWGQWRDERVAQTWIAVPIIKKLPFNQYSWPLPQAPQETVRTWTVAPQQQVTANPIVSAIWQLPFDDRRLALTWSPYPNIILESARYVPSRVVDWGLNEGPPRIDRTWTQRNDTLLAPVVVAKPVVNTWALPPLEQAKALEWQQSNVVLRATIKPVAQNDWPLPIREPLRAQTWTQSPMFAAPQVYMPSRVISWGVPREAQRPLDWIPQSNAALHSALPTMPRNQYNWPLPIQSQRDFSLLTWINQGIQFGFVFRAPAFALRPLLVPFTPWQPQLNVMLLTTPPSAKPVKQNDWPLPIREPQRALTWTQSPNFAAQIQVSYIPGVVTDWGTVPDVRELRTWTASPTHATLAARPVNQYDWPLPIHITRPVLTWIQSPSISVSVVFRAPAFAYKPERVPFSAWTPQLNVALLTTPPPAKPVNQTNWPLPLRAVEPAITWARSPNFAAQVQAGFIPCHVVDWGSFALDAFAPAPIQSNVALLTSPPPLRPISQYDWPLPIPFQYVTPTWTKSAIPLEAAPPAPELPNIEAPRIRDWWDRDEWGNFIPGSGIR